MEAYIDGNGNLLPSFYEASRWDIVKTFAFWKSLFVIAYHTIVGYNVYPKSSSIISEEETYPENTSATDISTESDFQQDEADKFNEEETAGRV
ncbi:hypothetical protein TNIN_391021 [Trichonephila inaurata madagascariensis]|uniref:Uncharacterized protein n=1 Tax=Trichonephila inaurata madagascariensis TaxID=2747483 RepID=A0A8X7CBR3_9ARAC|nr:hypothetical protein TNIN_391021 [Trichonephila inaurata madagascariensis]